MAPAKGNPPGKAQPKPEKIEDAEAFVDRVVENLGVKKFLSKEKREILLLEVRKRDNVVIANCNIH